MRKQVRLSEADIKNMVSDAVYSILEMEECGPSFNEYTPIEEEDDDFNEQPINNVTEGIRQVKVTESELFGIIKEAVIRTINESGENSIGGKYGLALKASKLAQGKGRFDQADNLMGHAVRTFNKDHATDGLEMDGFGRVTHIDKKGRRMHYRPGSKIRAMDKMRGYQGGTDALRDALSDNEEIRKFASTAKAYPRKRMMSGLDKIEAVDADINGDD